jgi:hypothetical protein
MAGYIEDRWMTKRPDETGERRKTERYGIGKRYRVAGIAGVRDRSFERLGEAKAWKVKAEHETRAAEFIDPRLGQITLAAYIEEHWWPTRGGDPATVATVRSRIEHIIALLGTQQLNGIRVPQLRLFIKEMDHVSALRRSMRFGADSPRSFRPQWTMSGSGGTTARRRPSSCRRSLTRR